MQANILKRRINDWEQSEKERIAAADSYKAEISERIRQLLRIKKFAGTTNIALSRHTSLIHPLTLLICQKVPVSKTSQRLLLLNGE